MTHRFLRLATTNTPCSDKELELVGTFAEQALRICRSVVRLHFKDQIPATEHIDSILLRPIVNIIWDTHRVARVIREDVSWTQYWPSCPSPGQPYNPAEMYPTAETERPAGDLKKWTPEVYCALSLGLTFGSVNPRLTEGVGIRAEVLLGDRLIQVPADNTRW